MPSSVPALVQAFAILRLLGNERALTLSEVASACSISPSSCLGLLRTLVDEGALQFLAGKRYALAPALLGFLSSDQDVHARLITRTRPLLARMARKYQAPIGLWQVVSRDRLQLVGLGESSASTRIHMEEGQRQPIGGGAVGRAFAAAQRLSRTETMRRFAAIRWLQPVSLGDYVAQIASTVIQGYAKDDGLTFPGVVSIAVTVPAASCTFCLSASFFAGSRSDDEIAGAATALKDLAFAVAEQNYPADASA